MGCLKIVYHFAPGKNLIRLAPRAEDIKTIQGEPKAFGLWVYGDGVGNTLGLRFVDQTGQVFEEGGTPITWKGWRYAVFPMSTALAKHWGGADDGVIHYPIRWDTLFLVSNAKRQETQGIVFISAPTLIFGN
jgi:hypothetical protein